ncbi:hypothetical protein K469DRAFT_731897 [Zopfia rhizophila CBS 207.26]|uniref:ABM domain-containing protein n=1 Tax=Zopfia rhizophila CBS 207.26 TaxID=1314779 RepID=A0A6A6DIS1_9PEZI|nr:hypothetical protein K469DRAFT_731897 [Zopfia rhizophila CBS 207.26]
MKILEVTQLRLKGVSATDRSLLENLSTVRKSLKTNSQFYHCIEDPSLIYILGMWLSLDAHKAFLDSQERAKVLGPQEDQLEFKWTLHMELDGMSSLPLDAPVMSIARLFINDDQACIDAYNTVVANHKHTLIEATRPYKVVGGWRCDAEPGKHEALLFTGWESVEAHKDFTAKAGGNAEYAGVRENYEGMEVCHARNMER